MTYYQETDSKMIFSFPHEPSYSVPIEPIIETTGGSLNRYFLPLPEESSLIKTAWTITRQTENQTLGREARKFLSDIDEMIVSFQQFGFDLGYLPSLQGFNVEDGSILIEWIFGDFRIGFNIEPNPNDSGWYLVSNKNLGEISASGYTSGIEIKNLILWLLNFILSNS